MVCQSAALRRKEKPPPRGEDIRVIQALLGHSKPETTARYSRVAIGLISKIESPLEGLHAPRRRRAKRDSAEPPAP